LPSHTEVPLARFTIPELHREVLARGIVAQISGVTLWRWLSADALQPWRHRSWIFPRDPQFAEKAGRVLDLYAGTGSLGIECLSRGAAWADFVEQRGHVCRIIAENLEHTRLTDHARIHQMPVGRYLSTAHPEEKYAIILMDPPYADPLIEGTIRAVSASGLLDDEGLLIVGHSPRVTLADDYEPLHRRKFRRLGDSCFSIYEVSAEPSMP
jgi:16S rRNA (guanine(966)-N(2))-methyltransferase RsmD